VPGAKERTPGVAALEEALPRGAQLYVHDEEVAWLCHKCAVSGAADPHEHDGPPARTVTSDIRINMADI